MKIYLFRVLMLASLVNFLYSCSKDDKNVNPGSDKEVAIDGFITDEQGLYIQEAFVQFGNASTTTNKEGYFKFPTTNYSDHVYIKVSKTGYFNGSRTLFPQKLKSDHIRISLLRKTFSKTFSATSGAIIDEGKVKLEFPSNAIVYESGQTYNGTVHVAIKYLDPSDFSIQNVMPGDLVGLNTKNEIQQLGTYGMAAIELQSNFGAKLQIKENEEVMMKIEIPESLRTNAPSSIPLWYFDEITGLWKEQGTATKNENLYEGKVKHFSFWNCDISWPLIHLKGRIMDYSNSGVANSNVVLTIINSGLKGYDRTNNDGYFEGNVPENKAMILDLTDECGDVIFTKIIGPFSIDTDLGDLQVINGSLHLVSVKGSVVDCSNNGLANTVMIIKSGSQSYSLQMDSEGKFTGSLTFCNTNSISITAYDLNIFKQSKTEVYSLPGPILVSPLQICQDTFQPNEFVQIKFSDGKTNLYFMNCYLIIWSDGSLVNKIESDFGPSFFNLKMRDIPELSTRITLEEIVYGDNDFYYSAITDSTIIAGSLVYTKVANKIGEYYEGNFNGMNIIKAERSGSKVIGTNLTLNGSFRLKKNL